MGLLPRGRTVHFRACTPECLKLTRFFQKFETTSTLRTQVLTYSAIGTPMGMQILLLTSMIFGLPFFLLGHLASFCLMGSLSFWGTVTCWFLARKDTVYQRCLRSKMGASPFAYSGTPSVEKQMAPLQLLCSPL